MSTDDPAFNKPEKKSNRFWDSSRLGTYRKKKIPENDRIILMATGKPIRMNRKDRRKKENHDELNKEVREFGYDARLK